MMLSPRPEILLSYLTGLGPVGEPVEISRKTVHDDIGTEARTGFYHYLNELIQGGFVRRIAGGRQGTTGVLVVVKRLEDAH